MAVRDPKPVEAGSCSDLHPEVADARSLLDDLRVQHLDVGQRILAADEGRLFRLDFLVLPVLQRSYGLVDALIDLVDSFNAHAAAPLVRSQLDSLFRMSYMSRVANADDVLAGIPFRKMKDFAGHRLTDARLKDLAAEHHGWAVPVYDGTSGWIHLSMTHVRVAHTMDPDDPQGFSLTIPLVSSAVPANFWLELLIAMAQATAELLDYCEGWASRKGLPPGETRTFLASGPSPAGPPSDVG